MAEVTRSDLTACELLDGTSSTAGKTRPAVRGEVWLLVALSLPLSLLLGALAWRSTLMLSINPNEGWNAYMASAVAKGGQLYFALGDLRTDNYPPLSFYIIGALTRIIPDAVFAGRLVAWVAFLAIATAVFAILRALGNDRIAACFGSMLFAGYMASEYPRYVGMDDPEMLALATMCPALLVFARRGLEPRTAVPAALAISLGLFVKHNVIALPITVTLWLLIYNRRACTAFVAAGVICGAAGLTVCRIAFGPDFITGLLAPRLYGLTIGYQKVFRWLMPMQVPLAFTALALARSIRDRYGVLFALYTGVALLIGSVAAAGDGVNVNAMFEAVFAFSLAAGHLAGRLQKHELLALRSIRPILIGACGISLLTAGAFAATGDVIRIAPWIRDQLSAEAATREAVPMIAGRPGRAMCDGLELCYWAGKAMEVDSFNFREGILTGAHDDRALVDLIESGALTTVQINHSKTGWSPSVMQAIQSRYRRVESNDTVGDLLAAR